MWSVKWKLTDWKINGKDLWSREAWKELDLISKNIKIYVYHVDAHKKDGKLLSEYNNKVDRLAALAIKLKTKWDVDNLGPTKQN